MSLPSLWLCYILKILYQIANRDGGLAFNTFILYFEKLSLVLADCFSGVLCILVGSIHLIDLLQVSKLRAAGVFTRDPQVTYCVSRLLQF